MIRDTARRLLRARGRRNGTHCDACGRRFAPTDTVLSLAAGRAMHLHFAACAHGGAR